MAFIYRFLSCSHCHRASHEHSFQGSSCKVLIIHLQPSGCLMTCKIPLIVCPDFCCLFWPLVMQSLLRNKTAIFNSYSRTVVFWCSMFTESGGRQDHATIKYKDAMTSLVLMLMYCCSRQFLADNYLYWEIIYWNLAFWNLPVFMHSYQKIVSVISGKCYFPFVYYISFLRSEEAGQAIWPWLLSQFTSLPYPQGHNMLLLEGTDWPKKRGYTVYILF